MTNKTAIILYTSATIFALVSLIITTIVKNYDVNILFESLNFTLINIITIIYTKTHKVVHRA